MSQESKNYTPVSIDVDDATEGMFLNDVNVEVLESKFVMWDYQGKQDVETAALYWKMKNTDTDAEYEQWWSVGGQPGDLFPVEGGKTLGTSSGKTLNKKCKAVMLLSSLRQSGYSKEKSTGHDVSIFTGLKCHIIQVPDADRGDLQKKDDKKRTVAVVDKIIAYPGEKAAASGKGKGTGAAATATGTGTMAGAKAEEAGEVDSLAMLTVLSTLSEKGAMTKVDLSTTVFNALSGNPWQQKVLSRMLSPRFIEGLPGLKTENGKVSLAE